MTIYTFDEYNKQKYKLDNMKSKVDDYYFNMMKVVTYYINTNIEFKENHDLTYNLKVNSIHKYSPGGGYVIIYSYKTYNNNSLLISDEEYNDMIKYMKDPELYNSTKKFNL